MNEISSTQRTLEKAISALTVDVAHRFEDVLAKQRGINESLGVAGKKEPIGIELSEKDSGSGDGSGKETGGSPMVHKAIEKMNSRTVGFSRASSRVTMDRSNSGQNLQKKKHGTSDGESANPSSSSQQRSVRIKQEIKRRKSVVSSRNKLELSSQHSLPLSGSSTSQSSPDAHPPRSMQSLTTNSDQGHTTDDRVDTIVTVEDVGSDTITAFVERTSGSTNSSC